MLRKEVMMNRISDKYIEIGIRLRKEYLDVSSTIDEKVGELDTILNSIDKISLDLDAISKKLDNMSKDEAVKTINQQLDYLTKESIKVTDLCKPLNKKLDDLKKDEQNLYLSIKTSHPELSDDDIKNEFYERVIKKVEF